MASPVRRGILVAGAVVYAAAASATAPLTGAAMVMVAVPAAGVLVLAVRSRNGRGRPAPPADTPPVDRRLRRTATAWAVPILFGGVLELSAWLRQPAYDVASPDHPTLSLLLDPVTGGGPGRLVAWCAWLYAGWRVARR